MVLLLSRAARPFRWCRVSTYPRVQISGATSSVGVGNYPEPPRYWYKWAIEKFFLVRLLHKTLGINTHSLTQLAALLCRDVPTVRVNDSYTTPDMAADLMEHNIEKLKLLYRRGLESFGKHEAQLKELLA